MKIINAGYEFITPINGEIIIKRIEQCGRVCYKSEDKITKDSAKKFCTNIIKRGHEAVLEHCSFTVKFIVDRGISHEIVRHRIASYCQESTRYCNYSKDKFDNEITFIKPCFWNENDPCYIGWKNSCEKAEDMYLSMLALGATPQEARSILPNSLKTELVMTANVREWRNFFKLRTAQSAHPQIREVTVPLLKELQNKIPVLFDDIIPYEENKEKPNPKNDYIALIVGASGSGKTTIVEKLEGKYGLKSIQSYTTREPRYENEKGHIFITKNNFEENFSSCYSPTISIDGSYYADSPVMAYTYYNGNHYFATKDQVDDCQLYVIDKKGIEKFRKAYKGNKKVIVIYIDCPVEERFKRMLNRGDSVTNAAARIINDEKLFNNIEADLRITNIDLDKTVDDIYKFLEGEGK